MQACCSNAFGSSTLPNIMGTASGVFTHAHILHPQVLHAAKGALVDEGIRTGRNGGNHCCSGGCGQGITPRGGRRHECQGAEEAAGGCRQKAHSSEASHVGRSFLARRSSKKNASDRSKKGASASNAVCLRNCLRDSTKLKKLTTACTGTTSVCMPTPSGNLLFTKAECPWFENQPP